MNQLCYFYFLSANLYFKLVLSFPYLQPLYSKKQIICILIHIILQMSIQQIEQAVAFAFALEQITDRVYSQHLTDLKNKNKRNEALSLSYIMSEDGRPIIQLFGYHLAQKLADKTFFQMGKTFYQVLLTEQDLAKYCSTVWPDMGKYQYVIPIFFRIMKCRGVISLREVDLFIQICKKQINPFMAEIKQNIPPKSKSDKNIEIKIFVSKLENESQKEDLLNTGYMEKISVDQLFKNQFKKSPPNWPKQLYNPNNISQLNYRILLGLNYFGTGKNIEKFLLSKIIGKICRVLRSAAIILKSKGQKKTHRKNKSSVLAKTSRLQEKASKNEKLLKQYIDKNKIKKTQGDNRNQFIIKSLVQQLIFLAVQIKQTQLNDMQSRQKSKTKSVYVTQPEFPEIQYDSPDIQIKKLKFIGKNELGLFVSGNKGYIMDNIKSLKKGQFQLELSHIFKQSPIIQYEVLDNVLYLLKQNGLLYSWAITEQNFLNQVQTSFSKPRSPPYSGSINFLKVNQGVVIVNCTHNLYSRMQMYTLDLAYIGIIQLNQSQYQISYKIWEQSKILQSEIKSMQLDKKLKGIESYKQLVKGRIHENNLQLSKMLVEAYNYKGFITAKQLDQYIKWVLSFKSDNQIIFPRPIHQKLMRKQFDDQVTQYLLKLGYINSKSEDSIALVENLGLKNIDNRKLELLTLFEDNTLDSIKKPFITKAQFLQWIKPACLMDLQLKNLLQSLQYRPDGKVDMSKLFYSEHYHRIGDSRVNRFNFQKYKSQQIPPICIKQFQHFSSLQIVVYSLCFPLAPKLYICNMLNGQLLKFLDFSKHTSLPPKIVTCDKNGYLFPIFGRSINLWHSLALSSKQIAQPMKSWINLQSSQIIDMIIIYEQSTMITLTKDCIKIWDFDEICQQKQNRNVFQIKPGYKAVQTAATGTASKNYKKKILIRQNALSLFYFISPNQMIITGAVSCSKNSKWYVKSFAINKFSVIISKYKEHYQIPTKLMRELQTMAVRRKNFPPMNRHHWMSEFQKAMLGRIAEMIVIKLRQIENVSISVAKKSELQHQINLLSNTISSIYRRSMFKENQEEKRFNNLLKFITIQNIEKLPEILQGKFLKLYSTSAEDNKYDIQRILEDCMSTKQKRNINRILYLLSLIQKYSRPLLHNGVKIAKLISVDRVVLDEASIINILPNQLPLDPRIITKAVKMINSLNEPLALAIKIIEKYLPTRYRFLVPRHIKQIVTGKQSPQLNEYISNHYESEVAVEQVIKNIMNQNNCESIQAFLEQNDLLKFAQQNVIHIFPETLNCNFSLIQALQCMKIIKQSQAYYYCIKESQNPGERLSAKISNNTENKYDINEIFIRLNDKIKKQKIRMTFPKISFDFLKSIITDNEQLSYLFYDFLHGSRAQKEILTQKLEAYLKMVEKNLSLNYKISQWKWITGQKVMPLKPLLSQLLGRFPQDFRIVSVSDLKTALMSLIESQAIYNDLLKRIAYSCTISNQKLDAWKKTQGVNVQIQGMWVNMNHLFKFINDYHPLVLDLQSSTKNLSSYMIKIPLYSLFIRLNGDQKFLPIKKFRQILTLNLFPLSITNYEDAVSKFYRFNSKRLNIFQIQSIMPKQFSTIGKMLIDKYHRLDFQHRFTVINETVSISQVVQLFGSRLLTHFLFGDPDKGLPQFIEFQKVNSAIKKHLIYSAAKEMAENFALTLPEQMIELLKHQAGRAKNMQALTLSQILNHRSNQQSIIMALVKYMSGQSDSVQLINIASLLEFIQKTISQCEKDYLKNYKSKLNQKLSNKNLIQVFLDCCQPQNFPYVEEDSPKSYHLAIEHIRQILEQEQTKWFINNRPFANIFEFVDHAQSQRRDIQQMIKTLEFFTQNCICRVGISQIVNGLGVDPSFSHFYFRLKSLFKVMSKVQTKDFISLYRAITQASENKKCDSSGFRNVCQPFISVQKKSEWICAIYDKQLIKDLLQQQQLTLDCELKIEKLKNLYEVGNQQANQSNIQRLKKSLNYHKYLMYKYLSNDQTKAKQVWLSIKQNKVDEAKSILQIYGVTNNIHIQQLIKYFTSEYKETEGRKFLGTEDCSIDEIRNIIKIIRQNPSMMNRLVESTQSTQLDQMNNIARSKVYEQFVNSGGVSQYYRTYHSLLDYCQNLLQNKVVNSQSILSVQNKIRQFLIKKDISASKIYELLDLSSYDNIVKYLSQCLLTQNSKTDQRNDITAIIAQMAKPQRNKFKYPINLSQFQNLITNTVDRNRKNRRQYQYLYSELDILGVGYVNLNDIPKYRGKYPPYMSPYVSIPQYIDLVLQRDNSQFVALPFKYTGPILDPPHNKDVRMKLKQKLLKYELPIRKNQKAKLIKIDVCFAIFGQFGVAQDHRYQEFIKQKFVMQSNGLLDLSGTIDWLMESLAQQKQQMLNTKQIETKSTKLQLIVQQIDKEGGLQAFLKKAKKQQSKLFVQQLLNKIIELNLPQFIGMPKSTENMTNTQKLESLQRGLQPMTERYFRQTKKWDTFNNHFCRQVKNMAQIYYSLVFKFFSSHSNLDMHTIYSHISDNGELSLSTLWQYVENKGITGYSRADINQLFSAIDINSDNKLSYFQFCQFWMACQQIFNQQNSSQFNQQMEIDQINKEAKELFLQLCTVQLDSSYSQIMGIDDLVRFTNIPNVEKVDYLIRAVNNASNKRGPVSGSLDSKIQMSKSKLKIMMDKMKNNQASDVQNLRHDLIVSATKPDIYSYIKQGYSIENINKIIVTKYPKMGYQIVQHLHDLRKMEKLTLLQIYDKALQNSQIGSLLKSRQGEQNLKLIQKLINDIEYSYRKHPIKIDSYQHKQFGSSIASGLISEQVITKINNLNKQISQMETFINKLGSLTVPLYYDLEQHEQINFDGQKQKLVSLPISEKTSNPFQTILQYEDKPLYSLTLKQLWKKDPSVLQSSPQMIYRQIVWKDTDLVCKSESKVNILQNAHLYNDGKISVMPVLLETSNRFRIQGLNKIENSNIYERLIQMKPMIQDHSMDQIIDRIMSLFKFVMDALMYCYYNYAVTGLLVMPDNLLINKKDNTDVKFNHFLTALLLNNAAIINKQQTVNYVDGIDSKYFINDKRPYPPQAKLGIHTEAIDVYMLAHIIYGMYRQYINPEDVRIPEVTDRACEQESIWDWTSPLNEISSHILKTQSHQLSQKQHNLWVLLYECSAHDWFMRPKLFQLHHVIANYFAANDTSLVHYLFMDNNIIEELFFSLQEGKIDDAKNKLAIIPTDDWNLEEILHFRQLLALHSQFDIALIQYYNSVIQNYLKCEHAEQQPEKMRIFMSNAVNYLLMIPPTNGGQCFIVNSAFKNILNQVKAKRYLQWCDDNWRISEYQINKKIQKINMEEKLQILHKNSSFYHDISTLAQCRVTLAEGESGKKNDTSKKVAISFIHSCLVSNNINKIYAVYRSEILRNIYSFVLKQELQPLVLSIFQIATSCFNPLLTINRYKAVDEVYKVMMVISNSINTQKQESASPTKRSMLQLKMSKKSSIKQPKLADQKDISSQPVVSMQDFVNNYYSISGQQCRQIVLTSICKQQLCVLPVLTIIMNEVQIIKLAKIVVNLCYDPQIQKILRSPVVGGYANRLKMAKLDGVLLEIKQAVSLHTQSIALGELSTAQIQPKSYAQLVKQHIKYYKWYINQCIRKTQSQQIHVNYQRNFFTHFQNFLAKSQKLYETEIGFAQIDQNSLQIVRMIIKMHRVMLQIWTKLPCHPDFTAGTLRFLMKALQDIENDGNIYIKSKITSDVYPDILFILREILIQNEDSNRHDLVRIAIDNGFIQFYCRTVRKQFSSMQNFISKNVQNIHLTDNYHPEAQFRLICFYLLAKNRNHSSQICQLLIANQFPAFVVQNMLHSTLILDLRFFKANDEVVPFRYCNPLRAEAITIIGFVLSQPSCTLCQEICSRLIPWLSIQIKNINNDNLSDISERMKWVESIWLLSNIIGSQNQRLKYEFVNLRLHQLISTQIDRHPFLNNFFPEMTQTLRNSQLMISTLARSQFIK